METIREKLMLALVALQAEMTPIKARIIEVQHRIDNSETDNITLECERDEIEWELSIHEQEYDRIEQALMRLDIRRESIRHEAEQRAEAEQCLPF